MKKITSLLSVVLLMGSGCVMHTGSGMAFGAKEIKASSEIVTRPVAVVSPVHTVSVTSMFDVEYVQGPLKVEIYASDNVVPYIEVTCVNGDLTVGCTKRNLSIHFNKQPCVVKVSAPEVNKFVTNGSGDINIVGDVKSGDEISLYAYGSGDIKAGGLITPSVNLMSAGSGDIDVLDIDSRSLASTTQGSGDIEVKSIKSRSVSIQSLGSGDSELSISGAEIVKCIANGSGDIKVSGRCVNADLKTNGSGDIDGDKLVGDNVDAVSNGSGDIECTAVKSLNASSNGSGEIEYSGNPINLNINSKTKVHRK